MERSFYISEARALLDEFLEKPFGHLLEFVFSKTRADSFPFCKFGDFALHLRLFDRSPPLLKPSEDDLLCEA